MNFSHHFFRWKQVSIALWTVAIVFAVFGFINVYLIRKITSMPVIPPYLGIQNLQEFVRDYKHAAIVNEVIAALLITGWCLMRRRTSVAISLGAILVLIGFQIDFSRWVHKLPKDHIRWIDLIQQSLIWLAMLYSVGYGYLASKRLPAPKADPAPSN